MPLSSVFEKLKIRRGSNPPSPTSSSMRSDRVSGDHVRPVTRGSMDHGRVGSGGSGARSGEYLAGSPSRTGQGHAHGYGQGHGHGGSAVQLGGSGPGPGGADGEHHVGFNGQTLVGDHGHIDGQTEVARNLNEVFEHGYQPGQIRQPPVPGQQQQQQQQQQQHQRVPQPERGDELRDATRDVMSPGRSSSNSGHDSPAHSSRGEGKGLPPIPQPHGGRERTEEDRHHAHGRAPVAAQMPSSRAQYEGQKFDSDGFPITTNHNTTTAAPKTGLGHVSSTTSSESDRSGLPRSHGTFALPTVPQTPAFSDEVQAGLLNRVSAGPTLRERFGTDVGAMGYVPVNDRREVRVNDIEQSSEWRETRMRPLVQDHQLTSPRQLAPFAVHDPRTVQEESRRFVASQSRITRGEANQVGIVGREQNLATAGSIQSTETAYLPVREYTFHPAPPGATEPSTEHINRHLALLGQSFNPAQLRKAGAARPGKYTPLIPGIPVSTTERDRELINQREGLVGRIAAHEATAERSGARGVKAKNGLDERSVDVFRRAGWENKVGVLDTVDVRSRVLEPVIQEHVAVFETEVYELMIFRDIHKYHIYPFIQPIHDPKPTVLPTRHLFKDAQGQWREVIGDEAAERILGTRIDRNEGSIYTERWTESVSGIEYEAIERESVVVGRRGWVELVGERLFVGNGSSVGHSSTSSRHATSSMTNVEPKPRKSSFSATSPGRPVGQRSLRDAPPVPTGHADAHRSSSQIGRAM